jgi:hypothetical protein
VVGHDHHDTDLKERNEADSSIEVVIEAESYDENIPFPPIISLIVDHNNHVSVICVE